MISAILVSKFNNFLLKSEVLYLFISILKKYFSLLSSFWKKEDFWDHLGVWVSLRNYRRRLVSSLCCVYACMSPQHFATQRAVVSSGVWHHYLCPPPNSFVFYTVLGWKESKGLVLPRTPCLSAAERRSRSAKCSISCLIKTLWVQEAQPFFLYADSEMIVGQINKLCPCQNTNLYCLLIAIMSQH